MTTMTVPTGANVGDTLESPRGKWLIVEIISRPSRPLEPTLATVKRLDS
jgi:hypothetical protein